MWIANVDFPDELIEAHRDGRLVFFVGAGASVGAPSSLPTFKGLVEEIVTESSHVPNDGDWRQLDVLLGDLDGVVDVHRRIAQIIGTDASHPNALHQSVARVASVSKSPRIVTTNYDSHLSSCFDTDEQYFAPALPLGDDFGGIVYLHGHVDRDPRHLVATDRDFGRAYLTDAWAARFLERMFKEFTVLFIGYSHNDVVMSYLARGLPKGTQRFAMTSDPPDANWRRLGVTPIAYPPGEADPHNELPKALERWADLESMGMLDHHGRVKELIAGGPSSLLPEESSYLERVVAEEDTVSLFVEAAQGDEWLSWITSQPRFRELFQREHRTDQRHERLARWFAHRYVADRQFSPTAIQTLRNMGGELGLQLWWDICQQLRLTWEERAPLQRIWLRVLLDQAPSWAGHELDSLLSQCSLPADRQTLLELLAYLLEPRVEILGVYSDGTPHLNVGVRGGSYWLQHASDEIVRPNLDLMAEDLIVLADHLLRSAYRLQQLQSSRSDLLSVRRFQIEGDESRPHHDAIHTLIDIGRDSVCHLTRVQSPIADRFIEEWLVADSKVLQRLAIHALGESRETEPDQLLDTLISHEVLLDRSLWSEAMRVVELSLPRASEEAVRRTLDHLLGHSERDMALHNTSLFSALNFFATLRPDVAEIASARDEMLDENPSLASTGAISEDLSRFQPEELHRLLAGDSSRASTLLADANVAEFTNEEMLVENTVSVYPGDGVLIVDAVGDRLTPNMAKAIIRGWADAAIESSAFETITATVAILGERFGIVDEPARFLTRDLNSGGAAEMPASPAARELARTIWSIGTQLGLDAELGSDEEASSPLDGPLGRAINHWSGKTIRYWMSVVRHDRAEIDEASTGISQEVRQALEHALVSDGVPGRLAEVVLTNHLRLLHSSDEAWTCRYVLPLLDWITDPGRAKRCWDGFLYGGLPSRPLLKAGLMGMYLQTAARFDELRDEPKWAYCMHLAAMSMSGQVLDLEPDWMDTFVRTAPDNLREQWAQSVAMQLNDAEPVSADAAWQRWIGRYWNRRLASTPQVLTLPESNAMAEWTLAFDEAFPDAVAAVIQSDAHLTEHSQLLHRLPDASQLDTHPEETATLLAHLLRTTPKPFWGCMDLGKVATSLSGRVDSGLLRQIVDEAIRLGCSTAPGWLGESRD